MISASPANVGARVADVFALVREMLARGPLRCVRVQTPDAYGSVGRRIRRAGGRIRIKRCEWCAILEGKGNCRELGGKRGLKRIKGSAGKTKENTRRKDGISVV